uniref:Acyltransferase n=1 Tax=uncultured bacterial symbiont of Discodermia dissoluta TaxID=323654 RepID=Q49HI5_9BACT|nr:acyltransferase [uncultured bacterial symbiont of Discodermia dissoluta]
MKSVVWMFSGLGSQRYRMGESFFREEPVFKRTLERCDEIVRPLLHDSMLQTVYRPRGGQFEAFADTQFAAPALFSVQYSLAQVLLARGHRPHYLVGYSLGECVAYVLAGVLDLQDGLHCVVKLAELAREYCQPASMVAILAAPEIMHQMAEGFDAFHLAAINFNTNFVVTGPQAAESALLTDLRGRGIVAQALPVEYGFHSRLIDPMEEAYRRRLRALPLRPPQIDIISACQANTLHHVNPDDFWVALRHSIDFRHTVTLLDRLGDCELMDLGPSGTMANFIKYDGRLTNSVVHTLS